MRTPARLVIGLLTTLLFATSVVPASAADDDITEQLRRIPGLSIVDETQAPEGYRAFHLRFTQLADHRDPSAGTFQQRMTLLHKNTDRPMVMYTSGYSDPAKPKRSEPAKLVGGNQLSMEYRYFAPSIPGKPNWPKQLTIWQAATDQHEIIKAFQRIYRKNWITTGASKGGMTATYHRRFYPDDVRASVSYVAPNDVIDSVDEYPNFLANVGDAKCRADLIRIQREALSRRDEFERRMRTEAEKQRLTFNNIGSLDRAFELSIIDTYFAFWQYQPAKTACGKIPGPDASFDELYGYIDRISNSLLANSDQYLQDTLPYYYQAAYQLGSPRPYIEPLRDLLRYPDLNLASDVLPKHLRPKHFDHTAMPDIDFWVRTQSKRMLFVYGSYDPWGAEPFDCGLNGVGRDCHRYSVPGGNHGSKIEDLPAKQRAESVALVRKWAGVADEPSTRATVDVPGLDEDPLLLRRPRL